MCLLGATGGNQHVGGRAGTITTSIALLYPVLFSSNSSAIPGIFARGGKMYIFLCIDCIYWLLLLILIITYHLLLPIIIGDAAFNTSGKISSNTFILVLLAWY